MKSFLIPLLTIFGILAHAAQLAPWNPGGTFAANACDIAGRLVRTVDERGSWTDCIRGAETACACDVRNRLSLRETAGGTDAFSCDLAGNLRLGLIVDSGRWQE